MKSKIAVVLHNIRSAHNVGSIFRTADGAGVVEVILVGYTPHPVDRFGKSNKDILKTALGAEKAVPWRTFSTIGRALKVIKKEGYVCVAVEQDSRAIHISNFKQKKSAAYIFGNEVKGLSKSVRDASDAIVMIPMLGKKESLNVSVAAGVVLYNHVLRL